MKKLVALALVLTMAVSLAACGGSSKGTESATTENNSAEGEGQEEQSAPSKDAEYNLKFSLAVSDTNFQAEAWRTWADAVTEATDGRVAFTFYYDDTLIDANAEYQQLVAGIADIADVHRYASDGFVISENWKSLTSGVPEDAVVDFSYRLYEEFPEIADEYKDVKVLAQGFNGGTMYQLLSVNKEIHSPADMAGLTIWCEADWNGFVEACGATPVNTPFSEVYSSLQKNMYDGMMIPTETLKSCNFAEVVKYCVKLNLCYTSAPGHLMNLDTWNSLPADIQEAIDSCSGVVEEANVKGFAAVEEEAMGWAEENYGTVEIVLTDEEHDAFTALVQQANLNKAAELDAQGLPGSKIVESLASWTAEW
ncbi:MAG: TRAP transporter substrate-binding protein DctP [Lachnospiraceae bacterium]|nr:TRAP transporter substrate-binding protein DctP [Lachnospiraceae bacterium]